MCQVEQLEAGTPGRLKVTAKSTESDEIIEGEYNTVSTDRFICLQYLVSYEHCKGISMELYYDTLPD